MLPWRGGRASEAGLDSRDCGRSCRLYLHWGLGAAWPADRRREIFCCCFWLWRTDCTAASLSDLKESICRRGWSFSLIEHNSPAEKRLRPDSWAAKSTKKLSRLWVFLHVCERQKQMCPADLQQRPEPQLEHLSVVTGPTYEAAAIHDNKTANISQKQNRA